MYPELFKLPFVNWSVWSYGFMMVVGFLAAIALIRRLSRNITPDPMLITNAALYSLITGVVGSRLFYVIHHFDQFQHRPWEVFAIWKGGLEVLGGVLLAIAVIIIYLRYHKLPIRQYLDILAIGLMLALVFGRIGCFLRGDCFGKPTELPWGVRFPYASDVYYNQIYPDAKRNRPRAQLNIPHEFFSYVEKDEQWYSDLKPYKDLTEEQKNMVDKGEFRCLPVHPTQLYSSANGGLLCIILYLFWRRARRNAGSTTKKIFAKPGCTFGLMFIVYGITRFFIEFVRDDNPFEYAWWAVYKGGTVSQNLGIYLVILGLILMIVFQKMKAEKV